MGIVIIIGILIVISLYLIIRGSDKIRTVDYFYNETEKGTDEMSKRINEVITERDEYKELRRQEAHNNYLLTRKNTELHDFKSKVIDIMNDKSLLMINKIDEIEKLLSLDKDNNKMKID